MCNTVKMCTSQEFTNKPFNEFVDPPDGGVGDVKYFSHYLR